jgi:hypothetical protein
MASARLTATALCAFCNYEARLTGDDAFDVATSLRKLLIVHCDEQHHEVARTTRIATANIARVLVETES